MTTPTTVPSDADVTMTTRGALTHQCPHFPETDQGHITITWRVLSKTLELHSLAEYLREFKDATISHEQITDRIRHDLATLPGIDLISVVTTWDTAGMEVSCSTSPTPVGRP